MQKRKWMMMLLVGLCVSACTTMSDHDARQVETQDVTSEAIRHINAFRAQNGLNPVVYDSSLVGMASRQVVVMASKDVLSHEVDGDFVKRMNANGFRDAEGAENVGAGHASIERAIKSWIASPGHRSNMLLKNATRVGVVRADAPWSRYRNYWALIITSKPANAATASSSSFDLTSLPLVSRLFGD